MKVLLYVIAASASLLLTDDGRCDDAELDAPQAGWESGVVRLLNGRSPEIKVSAHLQVITRDWNRKVVAPYLVYMPEKRRLLMLMNIDAPDLTPILMSSSDRGKTWTGPRFLHVDADGKPDVQLSVGLTYLGNGMLIANEEVGRRWRSDDYGRNWTTRGIDPLPVGMAAWDPAMALRRPDGGPVHVAHACLKETGLRPIYPWTQACLQFSRDEGRTWSEATPVPQWRGVNEVALIRAKNGDWVAACRTNWGPDERRFDYDHWCGLAVSISRDEGKTWSEPNTLYQWGRHHPSMVLLPNGDIAMSYVVRLGYADSPEGLKQFGIEAVVSRDNGATWDLDHRYILDTWAHSSINGASQGTSSVLLSEDLILTAYGTGYRSRESEYNPRDIGLVLWTLGDHPLNDDRTIHDAPFDSDLRNKFDPTPRK